MLGRLWDFCFANAPIAGSARNCGDVWSPQRRAGLGILRGGRLVTVLLLIPGALMSFVGCCVFALGTLALLVSGIRHLLQ